MAGVKGSKGEQGPIGPAGPDSDQKRTYIFSNFEISNDIIRHLICLQVILVEAICAGRGLLDF